MLTRFFMYVLEVNGLWGRGYSSILEDTRNETWRRLTRQDDRVPIILEWEMFLPLISEQQCPSILPQLEWITGAFPFMLENGVL